MPNIKSAIKRVETIKKKNQINKSIKSKISTYIKKFKVSLSEKNIESAEKLLKEVASLLNSAASKNVIHKNNARRKQAHFAKLLDNLKKETNI